MPNHVHLIIEILHNIDENQDQLNKRSLISNIIGYLKMNVSKEIHHINNSNEKIWQPNYYDHIIRDSDNYIKICEYIKSNPYRT